MTVPSGKFYGSLPDQIFIKGVEWRCISTEITEEGTMDMLRNTDTRQLRKVERFKLLEYLEKNPHIPCAEKNKSVNSSYINQLKLKT
jgi:hypothetical protein